MVQIVADEELDPLIVEEVELVDIEHPNLKPAIVGEAAISDYHRRLRRLATLLGEFCARHSVPRIQVRSSCGFGELLQACVTARLLAVRH